MRDLEELARAFDEAIRVMPPTPPPTEGSLRQIHEHLGEDRSMKHACEILVQHELGVVDEAEIVEWACDLLGGDGPLAEDSTVAELARLRPQVRSEVELVGGYLRAVIREHFPDFAFQSPDGIRWGREALKRRCADYLQLSISPYELCRIVNPVEERFDYPDWLGDLYDACDWVEPKTRPGDVPRLEEEAKRLLAAES